MIIITTIMEENAMQFLTLFLSILLLNLFSYLTIKIRPRIYGTELFKPMLWNFKLSLLPFLIIIVDFIVFMGLSALSIYTDSTLIRVFSIIFHPWFVYMANFFAKLRLSYHRAKSHSQNSG